MNERDLSPPEDSIPLRLVVFAMTMICIISSCIFIKTSWPIMVLLITLAGIGSLVAYQHRHEKLNWMQLIVIVGILGVGANALSEFMNPVNGPADFWGPVVHFVAGTFALHTFDLKSRSDINLSALLGALILCFISPINKSIYFGGAVLVYIMLGTAMLYFDCMSRTQSNWLDKPMSPAPVLPQMSAEKGRRPSGSAQLTLATLPLISMLAFLMVPRSDETVDMIVSNFHNFNLNRLMRFLPNFAVSKEAPKVARNPYSPPMRTGTLPEDPTSKRQPAARHEPKREKGEVGGKKDIPSPRGTDNQKVPQRKHGGGKPGEEGGGSDQSKNPANPKGNKNEEEAKKSGEQVTAGKDNEDLKSGEAEGTDSAFKTDDKSAESAEKDKEPGSEPGKGSSKDSGKNSGKDSGKDSGKNGKGGKGAAAGKGSGAGSKGSAGADSGKQAGGGGSGRNGAESSGGQSPLTGETFDLDARYAQSEDLLMKVTSTRLFFLRRAAYDHFDGRNWTRSKDSLTAKNIELAGLTAKPPAENGPEPQPELSAEEQAAKELEEEKLRSLDGQLSGFGPNTAVHYVFTKPDKPSFDIGKANAFIVPKIVPSVDLTQSYEVVNDIGEVLPTCWVPQTLGYSGRSVTVDDYGQIKGSEAIKKGSTYKVNSQLPIYEINEMRAAPPLTVEQEGTLRESLSNYLQLPETISTEVIDFANQSAGDTGNWFTQADRICRVVRMQASYEAEKPKDYEPEKDRVKQFLLKRRAGNSRDFSSGFVVLCRAVGLPARCVTGFGYGTTNNVSGVREIRGKDAYSWAEVFIPDYGWVPFDPAPDGILPSQAREEGYNLETIQRMVEEKLGMDLSEKEGLSPKRITSWIAILMTGGFLLAGIVYGLISLWRWYRRRSHANRFKGPAWKVYNDVARSLKALKIERYECETLEQFEHRVRALIKDRAKKGLRADRDLPDALADFFAVYRAAQFGGKPVMPELKVRAQDVKKLVKSKGN